LTGLIEQNPAIFFPCFFVALWLTVTTILALLSGWFRLMEVYPDHDDFAVRTVGLPGLGGILGVTFGAVVAMAMSAIGGCWWPLDFEPAWMRAFAQWLPTTWTMLAFNNLMIRDLPAASALWPSGDYLGMHRHSSMDK